MKKADLVQRLKSEDINEYAYCLNGGFPNEAYTLGHNGDTWEVYYSERGQKTGLQVFDNEDDACDYFYSYLIKGSRGSL